MSAVVADEGDGTRPCRRHAAWTLPYSIGHPTPRHLGMELRITSQRKMDTDDSDWQADFRFHDKSSVDLLVGQFDEYESRRGMFRHCG